MTYICINCKHESILIKEDDSYVCKDCKKKYPIIKNRPLFLLHDNSEDGSTEAIINGMEALIPYKKDQSKSNKDIKVIYFKEMFPKVNKRDKHWKSLYQFTVSLQRDIYDELSNDAIVLDIGAGNSRYKKIIPNHINYISTDLVFTNQTDYSDICFVSSADNIPLNSNSVNAVFNFAVLEHVKYPEIVIREISRILKKNSKAYHIIPLTRPEHMQPYDFTRFTQFWIKNIFEKNGMEIVNLYPSNNALWTSFFYMYSYILTWPFNNLKNRFFAIIMNRFMYLILLPLRYLALYFDKYFPSDFPIYYWVVSRKL